MNNRWVEQCGNCKHHGHDVKNCWAKGGGKEGQAPATWVPPQGKEPEAWNKGSSANSVTSTAAPASVPVAASVFASPIHTFNLGEFDDSFIGVSYIASGSIEPQHPHRHSWQIAAILVEEKLLSSTSITITSNPVVSSVLTNTQKVPSYLDSGATTGCIVNHSNFVKYSPILMAGTTSNVKFDIVGCGIAELNVRNMNGVVNRVCFAAVHTPSSDINSRTG